MRAQRQGPTRRDGDSDNRAGGEELCATRCGRPAAGDMGDQGRREQGSGRGKSGGEKGHPECRAKRRAVEQRAAFGAGQGAEGGAARGKGGKLGNGLVGVHHQADRADQQQHGCGAYRSRVLVLRRGASGGMQEGAGGQDSEAAGDAYRVMEGQEERGRLGQHQRQPVKQRRIFQPGFPGNAGHQPVPRQLHLVDDFDTDRVERLPGFVRKQARQDEREGQQGEQAARGRQGDQGAQRAHGGLTRCGLRGHPGILPSGIP